MVFYKYQGAGNDFLIADNRDGHIREKDGVLTVVDSDGSERIMPIADLCDRRYGVGADGLILLEESEACDFRMEYFNSDGSGGMMCGNGGRCIVAFAADLGLAGAEFEAADGVHHAEIVSDDGADKVVRLRMKDVDAIVRYDGLSGVSVPSQGYFLDTGTRHYVRFVDDLEHCDVVAEGSDIRYNACELGPEGVNVNFVRPCDGVVYVRTYEKGVEDETFACGTGIVASCVAAFAEGMPASRHECGRIHYDVRAKRDALAVDFKAVDGGAADIWLTGPACFVAEIRF